MTEEEQQAWVTIISDKIQTDVDTSMVGIVSSLSSVVGYTEMNDYIHDLMNEVAYELSRRLLP